MAFEMWDYLSTSLVAANATTELTILPQSLMVEKGKKNIVVHSADDNSEERIALDNSPIFRARLRWDVLTETEGGVLFNMYYSTGAGNGTSRSFRWAHPTDGHKYTVRFDSEMERKFIPSALGTLQGFEEITLRILGRAT